MKETLTGSDEITKNEEVLKGISNFAKTIKVGSTSSNDDLEFDTISGTIGTTKSETTDCGTTKSQFKVCTNTLPEKTGFWTKVKNVLCYKIEVKLTPYEQKIEDEINEFLHQDVTWKKIKNFFTQEIDVTFKGKKIF